MSYWRMLQDDFENLPQTKHQWRNQKCPCAYRKNQLFLRKKLFTGFLIVDGCTDLAFTQNDFHKNAIMSPSHYKSFLQFIIKYKQMKRKSQIMYKFIFNKKLGMLFKNRKRIRARRFLALQINTKQLTKYLTIFQNSGILILKRDRYVITVN